MIVCSLDFTSISHPVPKLLPINFLSVRFPLQGRRSWDNVGNPPAHKHFEKWKGKTMF